MAGFAERHGPLTVVPHEDGRVGLLAADGSHAELATAWPEPASGPAAPQGPASVPGPDSGEASDAPELRRLVHRVLAPRRVAVLLVRRGGYGCALLVDGRLDRTKVGRRHVQGRTAAGGWSQQRFARRRAHQTDDALAAAVVTAERVLLGEGARPEVLATGGDRALVDRALAERPLAALAALPRGPHLAVGDPRQPVMEALPAMLRRVTVRLTEHPPGAAR